MRNINKYNFAYKNTIIYNYLNKYFLRLSWDLRQVWLLFNKCSLARAKTLTIAFTNCL